MPAGLSTPATLPDSRLFLLALCTVLPTGPRSQTPRSWAQEWGGPGPWPWVWPQAGTWAGQAARAGAASLWALPSGPGPGQAEDLTQPSVLHGIPSHMFAVRTTGPRDDGVQL